MICINTVTKLIVYMYYYLLILLSYSHQLTHWCSAPESIIYHLPIILYFSNPLLLHCIISSIIFICIICIVISNLTHVFLVSKNFLIMCISLYFYYLLYLYYWCHNLYFKISFSYSCQMQPEVIRVRYRNLLLSDPSLSYCSCNPIVTRLPMCYVSIFLSIPWGETNISKK